MPCHLVKQYPKSFYNDNFDLFPSIFTNVSIVTFRFKNFTGGVSGKLKNSGKPLDISFTGSLF